MANNKFIDPEAAIHYDIDDGKDPDTGKIFKEIEKYKKLQQALTENKVELYSHVIVCCVAIVGLIILEITAIWKGVDGTFFSFIVLAVAGLGGYKIKNIKSWLKGHKE